MTTKKTAGSRTTKRTETAAQGDAMRAAFEAHTLAQRLYRHLVATGRIPVGPVPSGTIDPRFGFEATRPPAEPGPWGSATEWGAGVPRTPPHGPGPWPV